MRGDDERNTTEAPDEPRRVAGLMSGTSLDGVDAAVITTDGERVCEVGAALAIPYTSAERDALAKAVRDALASWTPDHRPASFDPAEEIIQRTHAHAVRELECRCGGIALLGFHGQTVLHRPELGQTLQLGDATALARELGIEVVADLRLNDVAQGGQGAPIVPVYHAALAQQLPLPRPLCFLNIGGVANLTWIGARGELVAFDVGPGNGLIDELVCERELGTFDEGGRLGLAGTVDPEVLTRLAGNAFFREAPPKSLDRYDFGTGPVQALSAEDGCATLAAFTAEAISLAATHLPEPPNGWIVCGGGCHNAAIMQQLRQRLTAPVMTADQIRLRSDFIEAEAMAFLAMRSLRGLPITYPQTTGVPVPLPGGRSYRPWPSPPEPCTVAR